ncbi:hypothetical protein Hanom_Chr08g00708151 [Helianthus anomalus]
MNKCSILLNKNNNKCSVWKKRCNFWMAITSKGLSPYDIETMTTIPVAATSTVWSVWKVFFGGI